MQVLYITTNNKAAFFDILKNTSESKHNFNDLFGKVYLQKPTKFYIQQLKEMRLWQTMGLDLTSEMESQNGITNITLIMTHLLLYIK